ncbi:hypothetical protein ACIHAA_11495 [Streptomyces sp. NPDC052040]|uniref:hypothetical protein n=1 Tax=Streptomyces sp. NPDC052040 TaxID=3365682 RepID=UPI0037D4C3B1
MIAQTVCTAVSVAGLGVAVVTAYRKRFLAAARIAAYALVPVGLVMTGVIGWVAHSVFSPVAWAGFGVLGVACLLFLGTRAVERRGGGQEERRVRRGARREAVAPTSADPALGKGARPASGSRKGNASEDYSDIEAILKKHGL